MFEAKIPQKSLCSLVDKHVIEILKKHILLHFKNKNIPGNMAIEDRDLHLITNNDMNN
jgi:hypothetical protein